jgi:hypothetical protein
MKIKKLIKIVKSGKYLQIIQLETKVKIKKNNRIAIKMRMPSNRKMFQMKNK